MVRYNSYYGSLIAVPSSAGAADTCVPDTLRVEAISGRVISQLETGVSPLSQASVTLMKGLDNGPIIATRAVDAHGLFNFDRLKPGKYRLKMTTPHLLDFYLDLILKPDRRAKNKKEIVIKIGADLIKPCNGSSAEVRIKTAG